MQVLSFEYKKKKWKLIAYIVGGTILLIILLIAAITGQLQENNCDNSTTTTQTQFDSKDTTTNAKISMRTGSRSMVPRHKRPPVSWGSYN